MIFYYEANLQLKQIPNLPTKFTGEYDTDSQIFPVTMMTY